MWEIGVTRRCENAESRGELVLQDGVEMRKDVGNVYKTVRKCGKAWEIGLQGDEEFGYKCR